jgi:hypothetical protein
MQLLMSCVLILMPSLLRATYQLGDLILIDGKWMEMKSGILAAELLRPDLDNPEIENPEDLKRWERWAEFREQFAQWNSSNWEGFVGLWRLKDSKLVLMDLVYANEAYKRLDPERGYNSPKRPLLPTHLITGDIVLPHHFPDVNTTIRVPIDGWHPGPKHWPSYGPSIFRRSMYMKIENGKVVKKSIVNEKEQVEWHHPFISGYYGQGFQNPYWFNDPFKKPETNDDGEWVDLRNIRYFYIPDKDKVPDSLLTRGLLYKDESDRFVIGLPPSLFESDGFQILVSNVPEDVLSVFEKRTDENRKAHYERLKGIDPFLLDAPQATIPVEVRGALVIDQDIKYIRTQHSRVLGEKESIFKFSFKIPDVEWKEFRDDPFKELEKTEIKTP